MGAQLDSLLGGPEDIRYDTAQAIGERLLSHDSIRADLKWQQDVLEILAYTDRMQNDTVEWMQRLSELVGVCRKIGPLAENDALRTEAVVEMLFTVIIEAAVASRDGISLMDKQLRKAGDTDAADTDAEDFSRGRRKIHF